LSVCQIHLQPELARKGWDGRERPERERTAERKAEQSRRQQTEYWIMTSRLGQNFCFSRTTTKHFRGEWRVENREEASSQEIPPSCVVDGCRDGHPLGNDVDNDRRGKAQPHLQTSGQSRPNQIRAQENNVDRRQRGILNHTEGQRSRERCPLAGCVHTFQLLWPIPPLIAAH